MQCQFEHIRLRTQLTEHASINFIVIFKFANQQNGNRKKQSETNNLIAVTFVPRLEPKFRYSWRGSHYKVRSV